MPGFEFILFAIALLIVISIIITRFSNTLGLPELLLFIIIGMLAGSEGIGKIQFEDYKLSQHIGTLALVFILFSGGLDTKFSDIKPVLKSSFSLATLGVIITTLIVGLSIHYFLGFELYQGLLVGAIVSATDAAAVFSVLRSKNIKLKGNLNALLEFESGCNDPMAIFLALTFTTVIVSGELNILSVIFHLLKEFIIGGIAAYVIAKAMVLLSNRLKLNYEGLYPVLSVCISILLYTVTVLIGGSGFLAVYMGGIIIGNSNIIQKKSTHRFFDGLAWLSQIIMFLTLGLLVFPKELMNVAGIGLIISGILIFIARPVSVFISLLFSKFDKRDKFAISWVGLRGAVPIILATFAVTGKVENSYSIFNIVFFVVITSSLLQGWTIPAIAKFLKVYREDKKKSKMPVEIDITRESERIMIDYIVPFNASILNKSLVELNLPEGTLIVFIARDGNIFVPNGNTHLEEGDLLQVLVLEENKQKLFDKLK
jgi:cell volume regulation protein A